MKKKVLLTALVLTLLAAGFVPGWFGYDLTHPKAAPVAATEPRSQAPQATQAPVAYNGDSQSAEVAPATACGNVEDNLDPDFPGSPTTAYMQCITGGVHMIRISTEPGGYQWNGYPLSTNGTCPAGPYVCTVHFDDGSMNNDGTPNGAIKVFTGEGQKFGDNGEYGKLYAWTIRYKPVYSAKDAVQGNPPCGLVEKEDYNGFKDTESFHVFPGNFDCPNDGQMHKSPSAAKSVPAQPSAVNAAKPITGTKSTAPAKSTSCPATPAAAAAAFGGAESQWSRMDNGGWKAEYSGQTFELKVPKGYAADFDLEPYHPNGSASYVVGSASVYCK